MYQFLKSLPFQRVHNEETFLKLRLFKSSLKIDMISIRTTQLARCYNISALQH